MVQYPKIEIETLENGLRVCCISNPNCASVAVGLYVGVGSRHELPGEAGMAHVVEHMLFEGTKKDVANRLIRRIEARGGLINANTGFDETSFEAYVPVSCGCDAVAALCDMFANASFREKRFERERLVVLNEIREEADSDREDDSYSVWRALFSKNRLSSAIIGTEASVKGMTVGALRRFWKRHYVPSNSYFVICGDFDQAAVCEKIRLTLGGLSAGERSCCRPIQGDDPVCHCRVIEKDRTQASFVFAYRLGPWTPSGRMRRRGQAETVFNDLMKSRLWKAVMERHRGLAYSIETDLTRYAETGVWMVYGDCDPRRKDELQRVVELELERIRHELPSLAELSRVRLRHGGLFEMELHDPTTLRVVGHGLLKSRRSVQIRDILDELASVKSEDVRAVARSWLRKKCRYVEWILPKGLDCAKE